MTCTRSTEARRRERLVVAAARGDDAATEELLTLIRPYVLRYCRVRLADSSVVEEVVAQVVDDVRAALPGMSERRTPFPGWIFGPAARRVCGANAGFEGGRVDRLRPAVREALVLQMAGLGIDEIARSTGRSAGAVQVALHRGLRRLATLATHERVEVSLSLRDESMVLRSRREDPDDDMGSLDLAAARRDLAADARASHDPEPDLVRALASLPDDDPDTVDDPHSIDNGARSLRLAAARDSLRRGGVDARSR